MVIDFAADHSSSLPTEELESQVRMGDISSVLEEYENSIRKPGIYSLSEI